MSAEQEFEKWWSTGPVKNIYGLQLAKDAFFAAFALGRQSGIDSVNSLPHRVMFDAGVERGIKQGRVEGLEEALDAIKNVPLEQELDGYDDSARTTVENIVAVIRQRIKEGV